LPRCAMRGTMLLLLGFVTIFFSIQNELRAQATINREYRIKAAYLFNFGRYTHWPVGTWSNKQAPFVIGILGTNPFGSALSQIASQKPLQDRKIVVHHFKDLSEYQPCQILYVSEDVPLQEQKEIIKKLSNTKVLLVGERHSFLEEGGMVAFLLEANKVRFGVNLDKVEQNNLKISSKVIKLAAIVKKDGEN
jgi:hypothetical protein